MMRLRRLAVPRSSRGTNLPRPLLPMLVLLPALLLGRCAAGPEGELWDVLPEQHEIADPGILGASATGQGCGYTRAEALTTARRIAQFNLRSLTGSARYTVRYELLSETRSNEGVCMVMSALALEPRPHER